MSRSLVFLLAARRASMSPVVQSEEGKSARMPKSLLAGEMTCHAEQRKLLLRTVALQRISFCSPPLTFQFVPGALCQLCPSLPSSLQGTQPSPGPQFQSCGAMRSCAGITAGRHR